MLQTEQAIFGTANPQLNCLALLTALWSHCGCAVDTACTKKPEKGRCFDTIAEYPVTAKTKETAILTLQ
jgi:hypothetical protein